jgi:mRNA-degrading endonuclease RelE of RelBE toxin-antitoxin system
MKVEVSSQVTDFIRRQAPEPRRLLRRALKELTRDKGDIKPLEAPLEEYCRLRVRGYRIIVHYTGHGSIQCVFAERRSIVYEVFAQTLVDRLAGHDE